MGEASVEWLDEVFGDVDAPHVGAAGHEFQRYGLAEAAQPDDHDVVGEGLAVRLTEMAQVNQ